MINPTETIIMTTIKSSPQFNGKTSKYYDDDFFFFYSNKFRKNVYK